MTYIHVYIHTRVSTYVCTVDNNTHTHTHKTIRQNAWISKHEKLTVRKARMYGR